MPKLKKLKAENKLLIKEVKKLKEHFATDKNLKQMKTEAIECFNECKKILTTLDEKVQQDLLNDILGGEAKAL